MDDTSSSISASRRLIYVPILHTAEDLGSLRDSVRQASMKKAGRIGWKRKSEIIESIWGETEKAVENLDLPWDRVRIYQDGLPICGRETELVAEIAKTGSRNYRLVLDLINRGATIMGTESLELLMEEYDEAKRSLASKPEKTRQRRPPGDDALLQRRDRFIAERINDTLQTGETGLVFLGMLHSLESWLDPSIEVVYLLNRPEPHRLVSDKED